MLQCPKYDGKIFRSGFSPSISAWEAAHRDRKPQQNTGIRVRVFVLERQVMDGEMMIEEAVVSWLVLQALILGDPRV